MILVVHFKDKVVEVIDMESDLVLENSLENPMKALFNIASIYPERILIWCHKDHKNNLNIEGIKTFFYLKNMMFSYSHHQYFPSQIGYVELSPFIKVNTKVTYPTWLMSTQVGAIYASQLLKFNGNIAKNTPFGYALNSIAKTGMPKGLFCYSNPNLLKDPNIKEEFEGASISLLFKFVKQHYRFHWLFFLLVNFIWHEKRFPLLLLLKSLGLKKKDIQITINIERINRLEMEKYTSIDVIIPTIRRKKYLYDFLKDLSNQTYLPKNVIIVEQNPDKNSKSDLDYITTEEWPFNIKHQFIHKLGACNARNLALKQVVSEWVFLADDDLRIDNDLLMKTFQKIKKHRSNSLTTACLKPNEKHEYFYVSQTSIFGSGSSFVKSEFLKDILFDTRFEFGFGEDIDFGMQLRNKGVDIIYCPDLKTIHLKAPMGGFRTKFEHDWDKDIIQPKPSPTIMLYNLKHRTQEQLNAYKLLYFIQFYKKQSIKNPIKYINRMNKHWKRSIIWANRLTER